jgi:hypothetical protein
MILGSPSGPTVTSPRVRLKDGWYLAYKEAGVDRETAKFKIILTHGAASTKESGFHVSQVTTIVLLGGNTYCDIYLDIISL